MNFAFLALACFAKKTSQKRSCTHLRIPPSRTARESGAPFTWKSHTRDQNGKDRATRPNFPDGGKTSYTYYYVSNVLTQMWTWNYLDATNHTDFRQHVDSMG